MKASDPAPAGKNGLCGRAKWGALGVVLACALAASCSASDTSVQLGLAPGSLEDTGSAGHSTLAAAVDAGAPLLAVQPSPRPETEAAADVTQVAAAQTPEAETTAATATPEADAAAQPEAETVVAAESESPAEPEPEEQVAEAQQPEPAAPAEAPAPRKRGFLSAFFSSAEAAPAAKPNPLVAMAEKAAAAEAAEAPQEEAKPIIALASNVEAPPMQASFSGEALPGVRDREQLFEIVRKSNADDDSDVDLYEGENLYQVASAAGLARLAPNGLLKQRESVDVTCLKPALVRMLKTIENHYGKKVVVTSGYRSPEYNRRVRGARRSQHMFCAAADIQLQGVTKWELARFARSLPGRGGVGTYCHTNSVHVDIGPERDWNWRCRAKR